MKLACSSVIAPGRTLTEKADFIRKLGYEGMSVFVDYCDWNEDMHSEVLVMKEKTGITPCEIVFGDAIYGHLMDSNPDLRKAARKMYSECGRACAQIGAVTELEYSYGPRNPLPVYEPYLKMSPAEEAGFLEMFAELEASVEGSDAYFLIENINRYESPYLNTLADCVGIVKKSGLKRAGVLCDVFHMTIEEQDIPGEILKSEGYIKHVHLGDTNRLMPRRGFLDWKPVFDAFKGIGYDGFCTLECAVTGDTESDLRETAEFILPLMK